MPFEPEAVITPPEVLQSPSVATAVTTGQIFAITKLVVLVFPAASFIVMVKLPAERLENNVAA